MNANLDKLCFQVKDILRNYGKQQTVEGAMTAEVIMEHLIFIKFFEQYSPKLHGEKRLKVFDRMIAQFPDIKTFNNLMEPYMTRKSTHSDKDRQEVINGEYYLHKLISQNEPTSKIFKDTLCLGDRISHDDCTIKILEALYLADIKLDDVGDIHEYFIQDEAKQKSKMYGQFFTPNEICMKAIDIVKPKLRADGSMPDCIDPAAGSFKFMRNLAKRLAQETVIPYDEVLLNHCYGCEIETKAYKALQYNILMETGDISENVYNSNSLKYLMYGKNVGQQDYEIVRDLPEYDTTKRYDYIFANPPFGCKTEVDMFVKEYVTKTVRGKDKVEPLHNYLMKTRNSDGMFIQLIIHLLKDAGEACVVLCGSIFNKDLSALRKYWLETCNLKSITVCPKDIFKNTSIETYLFHIVKGEPTKETVYYNFDGTEIGRRSEFGDVWDIGLPKVKTTNVLNQIQRVKLCDVLKIVSGKANTNRNNDFKIPYYDSNGVIGYVENELYEGEYTITARNLSIGAVHFVNSKFYPSDHTINFTSHDLNVINNKFFYYWLSANNHILKEMSRGVKPGIRKSEVEQIEMPLPPIGIQNQIVKKLDALDKNIELTKAKIEADKEYMKILLEVETVGCEQVRLGDVCKVNQGKFLASDDRQDGEYKIYGGGESSKTHNTHNVEARNMVFPRVGNPMIHWITERFYLTDNGFTMEPKDINVVSKKFVYYHMINAIHADGLYKGSCQKKTTKELVGNIQITLPTLLSQEEIVGKLDNIECMISAANAHIERLQSTKQRVLSYYLNM